jgi:hypothetical protein
METHNISDRVLLGISLPLLKLEMEEAERS